MILICKLWKGFIYSSTNTSWHEIKINIVMVHVHTVQHFFCYHKTVFQDGKGWCFIYKNRTKMNINDVDQLKSAQRPHFMSHIMFTWKQYPCTMNNITANVHNKTHNTEKQSDWDSHWALTQGFTLVYNWNANESDFNLKAWQRYLLWLCISTQQLELLKWNKLQWNMNMIFHLQNTRYTDCKIYKVWNRKWC